MNQINTSSSKTSLTRSERNMSKGNFYAVQQKVAAITSLRNILEYPTSEGYKLSQHVSLQVNQIIQSFGYEFYDQIKEYEHLDKKALGIEEQIKLHGYHDGQDNLIYLRDRQQQLQEDNNFNFLLNIYQGNTQIQDKSSIFEDNKKKYYHKRSKQWFDSDYTYKLVSNPEILSQGITLHHIIEGKQYNRYKQSKGTLGSHPSGTIYTLIKGGEDDIQDTMQHEHIHNIYEAFLSQNIDVSEQTINDILNGSHAATQRFINSCQGEIIANYDELLHGNMATEYSVYKETMQRLNEYMNEFDTLSEDWVDMDECIQLFYDEIQTFYSGVQNLLTIANNLAIESEIKSLMILYKPTQYHKIFEYLESFYGVKAIHDIKSRENKVALAILEK